MNRLEPLKAGSIFTVNNRIGYKMFKLEPSAKYVAFFDPLQMGPDCGKFMASNPNITFYSVNVPQGKTLDDVIRIFEESREEQ